ncbi:hypothetical protein [Sphingobacterium multivorum]|uniref:hypothetical protein n=1 Tax=Sphingobacterium multivorum TaxID=28454 RepID=UPI0028B0E813|nr:hypothetical protein [Sphingobacterium multivorum]
MNKKCTVQDVRPGMAILALAIVAQSGHQNLPNDIPEEHEEELPENTPDQEPEIDQEDLETDEELDFAVDAEEPEIPRQDDFGFDEEIGSAGEDEFPEEGERDENEGANDAEGLPTQPVTTPSDLDATTL